MAGQLPCDRRVYSGPCRARVARPPLDHRAGRRGLRGAPARGSPAGRPDAGGAGGRALHEGPHLGPRARSGQPLGGGPGLPGGQAGDHLGAPARRAGGRGLDVAGGGPCPRHRRLAGGRRSLSGPARRQGRRAGAGRGVGRAGRGPVSPGPGPRGPARGAGGRRGLRPARHGRPGGGGALLAGVCRLPDGRRGRRSDRAAGPPRAVAHGIGHRTRPPAASADRPRRDRGSRGPSRAGPGLPGGGPHRRGRPGRPAPGGLPARPGRLLPRTRRPGGGRHHRPAQPGPVPRLGRGR